MLKVTNLSKAFGAHRLWHDMSFSSGAGTLTALMGASGAGKSTLLNCIGRLQNPDAGEIFFEDINLLRLSGARLRRFRRDTLGYLFQNYALVEDATVLDNLKLALPRRHSREELTQALARVGLEDKLLDRVSTLSGGEQQRVALARIISRSAKLILADEPTGALDSRNAEAVVKHLRALATKGATVIIATHNRVVWEACDQVVNIGWPKEISTELCANST